MAVNPIRKWAVQPQRQAQPQAATVGIQHQLTNRTLVAIRMVLLAVSVLALWLQLPLWFQLRPAYTIRIIGAKRRNTMQMLIWREPIRNIWADTRISESCGIEFVWTNQCRSILDSNLLTIYKCSFLSLSSMFWFDFKFCFFLIPLLSPPSGFCCAYGCFTIYNTRLLAI